VEVLSRSGCDTFIVHARKAWLSGLSPKENRDVPELRHDWVYRLKSERPELTIVLNGGITTRAGVLEALEKLDGVMLGRAAYHTPWLLAELQQEIFGATGVESREEAVEAMTRYIGTQMGLGVPVKNISRHVLGLFQGLPGARRWRRYISENAHLDAANGRLLQDAFEYMQRGIAVAPGSVAVHGNTIQ
jgi:tRNA-dihydrouridine synthase A